LLVLDQVIHSKKLLGPDPDRFQLTELYLIALHWLISQNKQCEHNSYGQQIAQELLLVTKSNIQYFINIDNNK